MILVLRVMRVLFFQDINCKSYSTKEVMVARRYHEKIMGS